MTLSHSNKRQPLLTIYKRLPSLNVTKFQEELMDVKYPVSKISLTEEAKRELAVSREAINLASYIYNTSFRNLKKKQKAATGYKQVESMRLLQCNHS